MLELPNINTSPQLLSCAKFNEQSRNLVCFVHVARLRDKHSSLITSQISTVVMTMLETGAHLILISKLSDKKHLFSYTVSISVLTEVLKAGQKKAI